jgi:hypothetical protein
VIPGVAIAGLSCAGQGEDGLCVNLFQPGLQAQVMERAGG